MFVFNINSRITCLNKSILFFCIVSCFLCYSTLFSNKVFSSPNEWLSIKSNQASNTQLKINTIASDNNNLIFKVEVPGAIVSERSVMDDKYHFINIPGCLPLNNIGKPMIPQLIKCIAIPSSCTIDNLDIKIVSSEFSTSEQYKIVPVPKQIKRKTANGVVYFEEEYLKDEKIYSTNSFFPNELVHIEKIGFIRDQKVMWLAIHPIQYNPVTHTLRTYSSIEVNITFNGAVIFNQSSLGPLDPVKKDLFLNYQLSTQNIISNSANSGQVSYPVDLLDQSNIADYLIITTDDLITNTSLDSFAHHKAEFNGFDVAVVKSNDIYQQFPDTTHDASIKDFLVYVFYQWQAPYFADSHLGYVLLVGEGDNQTDNVIPLHKSKLNSNWDSMSDQWYTCVNDDNGDGQLSDRDYVADFIIGRFSVENHQELDIVTQKTINYEKNLSDGDSWGKRISLVSGFTEEQDSSTKVLFDDLQNMTVEQNYYEIVSRMHRSEMDPSFVRNSFIQQINDGCAILNVCAHGGIDAWGDAKGWRLFQTPDIYSLGNVDKLPVILSFACNTANTADPLEDCLAENFLNVSNKGAIAFWGASNEVWQSENNFLCWAINEKMLMQRNNSLGVILYFANSLLANGFSNRNSLRSYILLGDPSLRFAKKVEHLPDLSISPDDISVEWSPVVGNSETIKVKVTNLGYQAAQDVVVQFFNGDPTNDNQQIGTDQIINLIERSGGYQEAEIAIEDIKNGELNVFVRLDPNNEISEMDETNNVASVLAQEPVFTDIASIANVADTARSLATTFGDYNNDGFLDIFVAKWPQSDVLYRNNGNNMFSKIELQNERIDSLTDLYTDAHSQNTFIDYDNDGDLDIYVYKTYCHEIGEDRYAYLFCPEERNIIYRNDGDDVFTISQMITKNGKTISKRVLGFFDYNQDGLLDIICTDIDETAAIVLYQKNSNGSYTDVSSKTGLNSVPIGGSLSFCDYNNDGYTDFYLNTRFSQNILFKNIATEYFVDVTANAGLKDLEGGFSFCDIDNDGYLDFIEEVVVYGDDWWFRSINVYTNNKDGTFTNITPTTVLDEKSWGIPLFFDYNNDGHQDLYFSGNDFIYKNIGENSLVKVQNVFPENMYMGSFGALGDYDNDGDIDIYNTAYPNNVLFRNKGNHNNWLVIKLIGVESNSFGIGSRVRVVSDKLLQIQDVTCEVTNIQNSPPLEFGLAEYQLIDTVEVRWPSGIKDIFTNVAVNQILTINEGDRDHSVQREFTFHLSQNFPNPFNTTTYILFTLADNTHDPGSTVDVKIWMYNLLGQKVRTIELGSRKPGQHAFKWDGTSDTNKQLSSGIYFYQIKAGDFVKTKKMILLN